MPGPAPPPADCRAPAGGTDERRQRPAQRLGMLRAQVNLVLDAIQADADASRTAVAYVRYKRI
jgi:hypothetical protein